MIDEYTQKVLLSIIAHKDNQIKELDRALTRRHTLLYDLKLTLDDSYVGTTLWSRLNSCLEEDDLATE